MGDMRTQEAEVVADAGDHLVRLRSTGFEYPDGTQAIAEVNLSIEAGEVVSVIGPSGCGKSTLLRLVAGLRQPSWGTVELQGQSEDRVTCTMVFQEETLLPWLKVEDNVALSYRFGKKRKKRDDAHVERLLEMVNLAGYAQEYPSKLSGGMKRRVAVLAAIAPLPRVLLLDEPFSALDEPTRIDVHRDVYSLIREFNMSSVLVTHDLAEAITLSDRVVLLGRAPARVVAEYEMPFDRERDLLDLRGSSEFLELYGRIWADLEVQIKAGAAVA